MTTFFDPLNNTINVYNKIAPSYATQWFDSHAVDSFISHFLTYVPQFGSILDAGCGCGREIDSLIKEGRDCVGVDLSTGVLSEARSRVPEGVFRLMDVRDLKYPDSLFSGILCIAVLNHLFEEDLFEALGSFSRVLKGGAFLGLSVKVGEGSEIDNYGRVIKYYREEQIRDYLNRFGFRIDWQDITLANDNVRWMQIIAINQSKNDQYVNLCSFCMSGFHLAQNRIAGLPAAGAVLWGDDKMYTTIDCSPMVDGHLLLISREHSYSFMGSQVGRRSLSKHKKFVEDLSIKSFGPRPIFLEHGGTNEQTDAHPCIDHAHLHVLPLAYEVKTRLANSLGPMTRYYDNEAVRHALASREYISYEDKSGQIFVKSDGLKQLRSQFFRIIISEMLGKNNYQWAAMLAEEETQTRFRRTLTKAIKYLDNEQLNQPIVSRIIEARRTKILSEKHYAVSEKEFGTQIPLLRQTKNVSTKLAKDGKNVGRDGTKLGDLGEKYITEEIIYSVFERNSHGGKALGDDAAEFFLDDSDETFFVSVDPCPRPIIFDLGDIDYRYYGWLSIIISLSDMAAMGAEPKGVVISCEMEEDTSVFDFIRFLDGVLMASERYQCPILGGNIKDAAKFSVTATIFGSTHSRRPMKRVGARIGDSVFAVGHMGRFWAGVLRTKHSLLLPREMQLFLDEALRFPEPNLWAAIELSKTGVVSACMDASDGPTSCLYEIAEKNGVDIIVDWGSLKPSSAVAEVARQLDLDPRVLMLTWGNWELVFTANLEELTSSLGHHPVLEELVYLGDIVRGTGRVLLDSKNGGKLPDLASKRFSRSSTFSHGLDSYIEHLHRAHIGDQV